MAVFGVSINIDVTKIDKTRIFVGAKGKYLDMTVFINTKEPNEFGQHGIIRQQISKEERESGVKGEILGGVKIFYTNDKDKSEKLKSKASTESVSDEPNDDVPF